MRLKSRNFSSVLDVLEIIREDGMNSEQ